MTVDRRTGVALLALAVASALEASSFDVMFMTDPVGPKAAPLFAALLLALAGGGLLVQGGGRVNANHAGGATDDSEARDDRHQRQAWRVAGAAAVLVLYAGVMDFLGFVVATTLCVAAVGRLMGAPPVRALASAFLLSAGLWYLFVWGLRLPLPLGGLWTP